MAGPALYKEAGGEASEAVLGRVDSWLSFAPCAWGWQAGWRYLFALGDF